MKTIQFQGNGLRITIEGESSKFFSQDLWTMAAIALIEEADTHGWEKEDLERHGNSEAADQFYAAILYAVARHYAVDALDAQSSPRVYEVLVDLLAQIVNNGRLDQVMRHYGQKPGDGDEM